MQVPEQPAFLRTYEGKARIELPPENKVFYNPRMGTNRDLAVLFAQAQLSTSQLRVCDPMTGSGVRAARYLLEAERVVEVLAADRDEVAVDIARRTARNNAVDDRMQVLHADAHTLFSRYTSDRFDLIDLDPFGSPGPFFESALRATKDGGVIAATATDMGPLVGARPAACIRKYGVWPIESEFEKELALRTLVSHLAMTAGQLELGIQIAFSHATDHYSRIYAKVSKGRREANRSLTNIGYLSYCQNCLQRSDAKSLSAIEISCNNCGNSTKIGGPFWLGPLWDGRTLESMIRHTPTLVQPRLSQVQKILGEIQEELDLPKYYYTTASISSVYRTKPPSLACLTQELTNRGYEAARTHFNPTGFRTNAPLQEVASAFRLIAEKT